MIAAATSQVAAAMRPCFQRPASSDGPEVMPSVACSSTAVLIASLSRQDVDGHATGELGRIGGRVENLDQREVVGGQFDLRFRSLPTG